MTSTSEAVPLTAAELQLHPEFPHVNWKLIPTKRGKVAAAKCRGGPVNIAYEVHGNGPAHIVVSNLSSIDRSNIISSHELPGLRIRRYGWVLRLKIKVVHQKELYEYCELINGLLPLMRYSTSEMAKDIIEVLDQLNWKKERQLNVVGISMGGMISQELGLLIPKRIASLSLVSTAAAIENTVGLIENLRNRINLFMPRSLDAQIVMIKHNLFSPEWLSRPDECEFVEDKFPTNGDRIGAGEVAKRLDTKSYTKRGFICQAIAAGWHHKTPEQLASLGDQVGRERIMVIHGGIDRMITFPHAHVLIQGLGGEGSGMTIKLEPGQGHVIPIEMRQTFNGWVEELIEKAERLS
ncbi:hypothetical protein FKW77_000582 [Venturia effusa]|uniref:AB hydrolase-1 domain-containing protein n=1 Tax=Venturia effusa TaxID=50376 RepID=A0A517LD35_9PEZI|nr:hypothetical protein FKW77_000582 [Venturia effusa]